jgi:two-component system, NtrC family, sensor histidine kinase PilS
MFVVALIVTGASFWYTHVLRREPGEAFRYGQVVLDVLLVTGVVHVTGGPESSFAPLYILVISAGALLLPLPGGVLIGALASIVYFADLAWGHQSAFTVEVALRIGLFAVVALITGLLGDRLRRAGQALGVSSNSSGFVSTRATSSRTCRPGWSPSTATGAWRTRTPRPRRCSGSIWPTHRRADPADPPGGGTGMGEVLDRALDDRRTRTRSRVERRARQRAAPSRHQHDAPRPGGRSAAVGDGDLRGHHRPRAHRRAELRTERLEAVAALSASLAHEIKNPLASIRSAIEQLGSERLVPDDRALLRRLVVTESDRLSRLLTEFLDYSGVRLGAKERLELRSLVLDCVAVAKQHPDLEGVTMEIEIDEEIVPVSGDPDLLHRALLNLVLNAAQHAGPEGRVVVSLEDERYRHTPRGVNIRNPVRLSVRDSGPGIPPRWRARIFDPFFSTRKGGSGLGLALVHRAVEAHSGVVFVERGIEGGAQFVIFLPGLPEGERRDGV